MNKRRTICSRLKLITRSESGFSLIEAMIAIVILAVGLLGVGYMLHVSSQVDMESISILHHPPDANGNVGLRDRFNQEQRTVYGTLK